MTDHSQGIFGKMYGIIDDIIINLEEQRAGGKRKSLKKENNIIVCLLTYIFLNVL